MSEFMVGDRVKHFSRAELGTIIQVDGDGTVHVLFDGMGRRRTGVYDQNWFSTHQKGLAKVAA